MFRSRRHFSVLYPLVQLHEFLQVRKFIVSGVFALLAVGLTLAVLLAGRIDSLSEREKHIARFLQDVARERLSSISEGFFSQSRLIQAVQERDQPFLSAQFERMRRSAAVVEMLFTDGGQEVFRVGNMKPLGPQVTGRIPERGGLLEVGQAFVLYDEEGKPYPRYKVSLWIDLSGQVRGFGYFSGLPGLVAGSGGSPFSRE